MPELPKRWTAVLVLEDERTSDLRLFEAGSFTWRDLPLPLTNSEEVSMDHGGAVVGAIESIERKGNQLHASGSFDLDSEAGQEAARLVGEQLKRFVSVDYESGPVELEEVDCENPDEEFGCPMLTRYLEARIMAAAIVAMPAFPSAVIVPEGMELPTSSVPEGIAAAAFAPPREWFDDPKLDKLQRWVSIDGARIWGHVAGKDEKHLTAGVTVNQIMANGLEYANDVGHVVCDDGSQVGTGPIPVKGGHASLGLSYRAAMAIYDDPSTVAADVRYYIDQEGIAFAGALRPGATDEQIYALRASGVSLDARPIENKLRMVASCCVNQPAWPKVRARMDGDKVLALVAAGGPPLADPTLPTRDLPLRVARLEELARPLRRAAAVQRLRGVGR